MTDTARTDPPACSRYLPVEPDALDWGIHVLDCGYTDIPPHTRYPPGRHPSAYMFTWKRGRVLPEFQVVYLSAGGGAFESRSGGRRAVAAGDAFLLFPGEWHRYRPDPATGWHEHWIGFDGEYARRLMNRFFSPARPVVRVGSDQQLLELTRSIADQMRSPQPGFKHVAAARTVEVLAVIRAAAQGSGGAFSRIEDTMHRARRYLLSRADGTIDLQQLAARLGMSYSRFRSQFKEHTGMPPRQYHLQIRINKAQRLLIESDLTVSEIAAQLGFSSVYYFSRLFRKKTGTSPTAFRNSATGS